MTSNYSKSLYKDYELLQKKYEEMEKKYKFEKLRADIAESKQQRFEKLYLKSEALIKDREKENQALKDKILELSKKLDITKYEKDNYLSKFINDGTNSGLPTSKTPINKKKIVPNSRKNTGGKIGARNGHKKNKLEKFEEKDII